MTKPIIGLVLTAAMLAIAESNEQRMFAGACGVMCVLLIGLRKTEDSANTVAALDARRWLMRAMWLALIPLCWMLAQYGAGGP